MPTYLPALDLIITLVLMFLRPFRFTKEDSKGPVFIDIMKKVNGVDLLYLRRWFLWSTPNGATYLHKIVRSDDDLAPHTHPWPFKTTVLWNGYNDEQYKVGENLQRERYRYLSRIERTQALHSYSRPAGHLHQVKLIDNRTSWNFVQVGKYDVEKDWGFVLEDGTFIDNETYLGLPKTEKKLYRFDRVAKQGL